MAFRPSELQYKILRWLHDLEIVGCLTVDANGRDCAPRFQMRRIVPKILFDAAFGGTNEAKSVLDIALEGLRRRDLIRRRMVTGWPLVFDNLRLRLPDGREACLRAEFQTNAEFASSFSMRVTGRRLGGHRENSTMLTRQRAKSGALHVAAWVGERRGANYANVVVYPHWSLARECDVLSITARGLSCLDDAADRASNGAIVTLSQVAPIVGLSKRQLERYKTRKLIPAPDFVGGQGKADKWYWNRLRPSLEKQVRAGLPIQFPGFEQA